MKSPQTYNPGHDQIDEQLSEEIGRIITNLALSGWDASTLDVDNLPEIVGFPPPFPWAGSDIQPQSWKNGERFMETIPNLEFLRTLFNKGWLYTRDAFWAYCCLEKRDPSVNSRLLQSDARIFGSNPMMFECFRNGDLLSDFRVYGDAARQALGQRHANIVAGTGATDREPTLDREYYLRGHNIKLRLQKGIFAPSRTTYLFAKNIRIEPGDRFFEVGFGSLMLSIMAAKLEAGSIKGSEVDPNAIELANFNAEQNGIEEFEFTDCDLFPPDLEEQDVIVGNVPQTPSVEGGSNIHIDAGADGTDIVLRFIENAEDKLAQGGRIYICVASIANASRVLEYITNSGLSYVPLAEQELPIPPYVKDRLESGHFKHLIDVGEIFLKDGEWHSRDTLYELQRAS